MSASMILRKGLFVGAFVVSGSAFAAVSWTASCSTYASVDNIAGSADASSCTDFLGNEEVMLRETSTSAMSSTMSAKADAAIRAQYSSIGLRLTSNAGGTGFFGATASGDVSAQVQVADLITVVSDTLPANTIVPLTIFIETRGSLSGFAQETFDGSVRFANASLFRQLRVSGYGELANSEQLIFSTASTPKIGTNNSDFTGTGPFSLSQSFSFSAIVGRTFAIVNSVQAAVFGGVVMSTEAVLAAGVSTASSFAQLDSMNSSYTYFEQASPGIRLVSASGHDYFTPPPAVPEQGTLVLMVVGLATVFSLRRVHARTVARSNSA